MGLGGALFAHSVGVVTPDTFYLGLTFITLSMLVVGGMNSLSGAVLGVVVLSIIIQLLRWLEKGVDLGGTTLGLPLGVQVVAPRCADAVALALAERLEAVLAE